MMRRFALPVIATVLLCFAVGHAWYAQQPEPQVSPPLSPPASPFGHTVAGVGTVEAAGEASGTGNSAVGAQVAGIVAKVWVRTGSQVKAGDPLVELDKRQTEADLRVRLASLKAAQAQLRKLELQPRPEEIPPSEAQVDIALATLAQQQDVHERNLRLIAKRAIAQQELVTGEQSFRTAQAQLALAQANLALRKAGAWKPDLDIALANIEQARAQVDYCNTQLELLTIRAPSAGTILQVNTRPGEYVAAGAGNAPIVMGNLDTLHVRVNVDEEDFPRLKNYTHARASVRGAPYRQEIPLYFVRLEPHVVPKVSLTGINSERVDTRVIQLIYAIEAPQRLVHENRLLVGQVLDVFIELAE